VNCKNIERSIGTSATNAVIPKRKLMRFTPFRGICNKTKLNALSIITTLIATGPTTTSL